MKDALVHAPAGKPEDPLSHLVRQHINQLAREGKIPTIEKALEIIRIILKNGYRNDTPYGVIDYVFRLHLHSIAHEGKLNSKPFRNQQLSAQEICLSLYASARKFSSTRRKLGKVSAFLKSKNVQTFIDAIASNNGHGIRDEPPLTIRRAPTHHIFSHA